MADFLPFINSKGITRHWRYEDDGVSATVLSTYDCTSDIDRNIAMQNHNDGYSPSRELRRVAHIPDIIALKWLNEEGWWYLDPGAKNKLFQKLNDPAWAYLRTAPGYIAEERMV